MNACQTSTSINESSMTNQNISRIETKKCTILRFVEEVTHLYQYNPIILHLGINLQNIFLKH
jgi:hypothetical protein